VRRGPTRIARRKATLGPAAAADLELRPPNGTRSGADGSVSISSLELIDTLQLAAISLEPDKR